jgi:hypothetical protein
MGNPLMAHLAVARKSRLYVSSITDYTRRGCFPSVVWLLYSRHHDPRSRRHPVLLPPSRYQTRHPFHRHSPAQFRYYRTHNFGQNNNSNVVVRLFINRTVWLLRLSFSLCPSFKVVIIFVHYSLFFSFPRQDYKSMIHHTHSLPGCWCIIVAAGRSLRSMVR